MPALRIGRRSDERIDIVIQRRSVKRRPVSTRRTRAEAVPSLMDPGARTSSHHRALAAQSTRGAHVDSLCDSRADRPPHHAKRRQGSASPGCAIPGGDRGRWEPPLRARQARNRTNLRARGTTRTNLERGIIRSANSTTINSQAGRGGGAVPGEQRGTQRAATAEGVISPRDNRSANARALNEKSGSGGQNRPSGWSRRDGDGTPREGPHPRPPLRVAGEGDNSKLVAPAVRSAARHACGPPPAAEQRPLWEDERCRSKTPSRGPYQMHGGLVRGTMVSAMLDRKAVGERAQRPASRRVHDRCSTAPSRCQGG